MAASFARSCEVKASVKSQPDRHQVVKQKAAEEIQRPSNVVGSLSESFGLRLHFYLALFSRVRRIKAKVLSKPLPSRLA